MNKSIVKGLKQASDRTKNNTPFVYTVWYDWRRSRVFTTNDSYEPWIQEYELMGYIKLLEASRHFTMREITQRIIEYYSMVHTWEKGLS